MMSVEKAKLSSEVKLQLKARDHENGFNHNGFEGAFKVPSHVMTKPDIYYYKNTFFAFILLFSFLSTIIILYKSYKYTCLV
jgi:hypothetical protein